jgi:MFS family permease
MTSWQSASQQVAVIFAATLGYVVSLAFTKAQVDAWAWRIPFFVGCAIIPLFLVTKIVTGNRSFCITQGTSNHSPNSVNTGSQLENRIDWNVDGRNHHDHVLFYYGLHPDLR